MNRDGPDLYTTSSGRVFGRCRREYYYNVVLRITSVETAKALLWGRVWDAIQAHLWTPGVVWGPETALLAGQADEAWEKLNEVDQINIEVLTAGYIARWGSNNIDERVVVKQRFQTKLKNPETGGISPLWLLAGELDAVCRRNGADWIVEHKSSGQDVSPGSIYWEKLKIDSQCSNYFEGARSLGYDPVGVLYDVVRKPMLQRLLATPEETRKYKKDGTLHASQRDHDETLDEYRARLIVDVAERPDFYFARTDVVRLEEEEKAAAGDVWENCQAINQCARRNRWARNTDACERYHRLCQFWGVCTGQTSLENTDKFQFVGKHPELER